MIGNSCSVPKKKVCNFFFFTSLVTLPHGYAHIFDSDLCCYIPFPIFDYVNFTRYEFAVCTAFMKQIRKDAFFLAKLNIMDYSLLIGIHDRDRRGEEVIAPPPAPAPMILPSKSVDDAPTDALSTPQRRSSFSKNFQDTRSKLQFRKSIIAANIVPDENEGSLSTEVNCMINDLNRYGFGSKVGAEKYGDVPCGNELENTLSCFAGVFGATWNEIFDEEIDINDIHCDDGDSDLDENQDLDEYIKNFETEEKSSGTYDEKEQVKDYLVEKGFGKLKNDKLRKLSIKIDKEEFGGGAFGKEGGALSEYFRSSDQLAQVKIDDEDDNSNAETPHAENPEDEKTRWFENIGNYRAKKEKYVLRTYGPGEAKKHPWTSREDMGINSRSTDGRSRENEIYFAGIIDILQQYNHVKTVENFFKGFVHDRNEISAVPAQQYAERFVAFLDENII